MTADTVIDGENSTQGWNRFAYVHNNPIRYKDPTGHDAQDVLVGLQKAFEKATCEQAKETKSAWNNGRPLKAAYHAANTAGAAIAAFVLPADRQEADMMALTAGMAPAAMKSGGAGSRLLSAASKTTVGKSVINLAEKLASKVGIKGEEELFEKGMNIAQHGNFFAGKDKSIFYSGFGNEDKALAYALKTGKKTIGMTEGGGALNSLDLYEKLGPKKADMIWKEASSNFAKSAEGIVDKFIKGAQEGRIYRSVEKSILRDNPNVTGYRYHY